MVRSVFLPLFIAAAGLAGAVIRRYELRNAFEPDTGLAIPGHPASIVLLALSAVVLLLLLFFLVRGGIKTGTRSYSDAFHSEEAGYFIAVVLTSLLLFASALAGAASYLAGSETRISRLLLFAFTAVSGFSVLTTGLRTYRNRNTEQSSILLLVPAFFACLWLVLVYQSNAADPVLFDYIYELLAVVCVVLSLYSIAGFAFGRGNVRRTSFYCLLGVYFSMVTMADSHSLPFLLLYTFSAIYLELNAGILLHNSAPPRTA